MSKRKRKPSSEILVRYRNDRAALLAQIDRLVARLAALEHENGELRAVLDAVRLCMTPMELARVEPQVEPDRVWSGIVDQTIGHLAASPPAPDPVPISEPEPPSMFGHG